MSYITVLLSKKTLLIASPQFVRLVPYLYKSLTKCIGTKRMEIQSPCLALMASLPAILVWIPSCQSLLVSVQDYMNQMLHDEKDVSPEMAGIIAAETASMFFQLITEAQTRLKSAEKVKKYGENSKEPLPPALTGNYSFEGIVTWLFDHMTGASDALQLRFASFLLHLLEACKDLVLERDVMILLTLLFNQLKSRPPVVPSRLDEPSAVHQFIFHTVVCEGICRSLSESHVAFALAAVVNLFKVAPSEIVSVSVIKALTKIIPILGEAVKADWQEHFALFLPALASPSPALQAAAERLFLVLGTIDVSIVESFVYRLAQELQTRLEAVRAAGMCEVTSSPASHSQKDTLTGVARLAGHLLLLLHTRQQPVAAALLDTLLRQARALLQLCADSTRAPDAQVQLLQRQSFQCCAEAALFLLQGLVMMGARRAGDSPVDDAWLLPELEGVLALCDAQLDAVTAVFARLNNGRATAGPAADPAVVEAELTLACRLLVPLLQVV